MIQLVARPWQEQLGALASSSKFSFHLAAPYIKRAPAEWLLRNLTAGKNKESLNTTVVTDISADNVLGAGLDIDALLFFADNLEQTRIFDVPRLHAKVFIADARRAIVTSGNLTTAAFVANYEYGVYVSDAKLVRGIVTDVERYARSGRQVGRVELARLTRLSKDLRKDFQQSIAKDRARAREVFDNERIKVASGLGIPPESLEAGSVRFKRPIMETLASEGPLSTKELCAIVQLAWPELCDDTVLRVAKDGSRKRQWRHDIHTAQETLQRGGLIERDGQGRWRVA